jgi:hypothetical protein
MRDQLFDREFQAGRADLFAGIDRFVHSITAGLALLHQVQWSAPWKVTPRDKPTGIA